MGEEEPKFRLLFTLYKNFLFADSLYVPFFASRPFEGAQGGGAPEIPFSAGKFLNGAVLRWDFLGSLQNRKKEKGCR